MTVYTNFAKRVYAQCLSYARHMWCAIVKHLILVVVYYFSSDLIIRVILHGVVQVCLLFEHVLRLNPSYKVCVSLFLMAIIFLWCFYWRYSDLYKCVQSEKPTERCGSDFNLYEVGNDFERMMHFWQLCWVSVVNTYPRDRCVTVYDTIRTVIYGRLRAKPAPVPNLSHSTPKQPLEGKPLKGKRQRGRTKTPVKKRKTH